MPYVVTSNCILRNKDYFYNVATLFVLMGEKFICKSHQVEMETAKTIVREKVSLENVRIISHLSLKSSLTLLNKENTK